MTGYELAQLLLALPAEQQQMQVGASWSTEYLGRGGFTGIRLETVQFRDAKHLDENDDFSLGQVGSHYIELF